MDLVSNHQEPVEAETTEVKKPKKKEKDERKEEILFDIATQAILDAAERLENAAAGPDKRGKGPAAELLHDVLDVYFHDTVEKKEFKDGKSGERTHLTEQQFHKLLKDLGTQADGRLHTKELRALLSTLTSTKVINLKNGDLDPDSLKETSKRFGEEAKNLKIASVEARLRDKYRKHFKLDDVNFEAESPSYLKAKDKTGEPEFQVKAPMPWFARTVLRTPILGRLAMRTTHRQYKEKK